MGEGKRNFVRLQCSVISLFQISIFLSLALFANISLAEELNNADSVQLLRFFPAWTAGVLDVRELKNQTDILGILFSLFDDTRENDVYKLSTSRCKRGLSKQFDKLIHRNLGISGNKFLHDVIGNHFVLGWGGPAMPEQFGLICRVKDYSVIGNLLTLARASPLSLSTTSKAATQSTKLIGLTIKKYNLKSKNIRAAVLGNRLLILATVGKRNEASMFDAMTDIASGVLRKTLFDRQNIRSLTNKLKPDYDFLFLLTNINTNEKSPKARTRHSLLMQLISSLEYFAIVNYHHSDVAELKIVSKLSNAKSLWVTEAINFNAQLASMTQLPADFVYLASVNPLSWYHRIIELADAGQSYAKQYRQAIELLIPNEQLRENFFESLGPELLILIGSYGKAIISTQPATMPASSIETEFPDITIAIKTSNPTITTDTVEQIFRFFADFVSIRNVMSDKQTEHITNKHIYNGFIIHVLDISELLGNNTSESAHQLCWCLADEYLIVSSRLETIYELIDRTFEPEKFPSDKNINLPEHASWFMEFKPASLAKRINGIISRLDEFQRNFNFSMHHQSRILLGIGTKVTKNPQTGMPMLKVAAVLPGYPAWGKLKINDIIIAVNGEAIGDIISVSALSSKITTALKHSRTIKFTVIRGKVLKDIIIAVPKTIFAKQKTQSIKLLEKMLYKAGIYFRTIAVSGTENKNGEIEITVEAAKNK